MSKFMLMKVAKAWAQFCQEFDTIRILNIKKYYKVVRSLRDSYEKCRY